jgi:hypothetical protein
MAGAKGFVVPTGPLSSGAWTLRVLATVIEGLAAVLTFLFVVDEDAPLSWLDIDGRGLVSQLHPILDGERPKVLLPLSTAHALKVHSA